MANMIISCPSCPQKLRVPEEFFGRTVKCPKCGVTFQAAAGPAGTEPPAAGSDPATASEHTSPSVADPESMGGRPLTAESAPTRRIRRDAEPSRGSLVLTLGIISIVLPVIGWIPGIAAITMGRADQKKIRAGLMDRAGADTTQAGWICGIIGTCLQGITCLGCGAYITFVMLFVAQMAKNPGFRPVPPQKGQAGPQFIPPPPPGPGDPKN
jgi:hypothetical protein